MSGFVFFHIFNRFHSGGRFAAHLDAGLLLEQML
jgi:hypothetical protein